tara:strand:- start:33 stop:1793 length:1761 start_codon:yes stop_codon:yes gene_type:complete
MKILKLLNKKYFTIITFCILIIFGSVAQEPEKPVDIWNTDQEEKDIIISETTETETISENNIYELQSKKKNENQIELDQTLVSKEIEIVGLYDPSENGLSIDMWSNSDGEQIVSLFKSLDKIDLSKDATEFLNILLLTNSYYPDKNISKEKFLEIKSKWLIKNSDLEIIENYLLKNQIVNENPELMKYLVDEYLSKSEIKKSCEIFSNVKKPITDNYLSKFKIYCLINDNKNNEAQLLLDLKKELGFNDELYENKISYLLGYNDQVNLEVSQKSILDFHISHRVNQDFVFEPKDTTSRLIWRYLSTSNLLGNIKDIELTNLEKISTIEKATHEGNYTEKELYELYKRFQFNINQFIQIDESYKMLSNIESRALIYQGILITDNIPKKIELIKMLKDSFVNENISNAFNLELKKLLREINPEDVPLTLQSFYNTFVQSNIDNIAIKTNNKILHQSKLINYFRDDYSSKNTERELNDFLKKIKRDKKYFFSRKDTILVEALKSDGIKVSERYKDLYELNDEEIPADIQLLIKNEDIGMAMLRIVQVIGQDQIKDIDIDTMYFVISTLNQLNIDPLRNKLILKVLSLKV